MWHQFMRYDSRFYMSSFLCILNEGASSKGMVGVPMSVDNGVDGQLSPCPYCLNYLGACQWRGIYNHYAFFSDYNAGVSESCYHEYIWRAFLVLHIPHLTENGSLL
jgi:hypothetical protein